jgi:thiamine transport system substrate-binding protein
LAKPTQPAPTATKGLEPTQGAARTLTLMSHDSFNASEDVIAEFEQANNAKVEFLKSGDAGAALNQAILSKGNPLADVFFGVDNTFFSRAIDADIFEPYQPQGVENITDTFKLDPQFRLTPIDWGDVCLNYDKRYFEEKNLKPPVTLEDLTKPEYKGLLVVENPATSSPGLAFLLTTIAHFGADEYLDYWEDLRKNDVTVTTGWEDAYYGQFSGGSGSQGDKPIVVSYATSPPAEVFFSEGALTEPPTAAVIADGTCFRQIEFAGILKGTQNRDLAEKFMDFLISKRFQEDVPLQMFVFPVNRQATLPEVFVRFAQIAPNPAQIGPDEIDANRDQWIEAWDNEMRR